MVVIVDLSSIVGPGTIGGMPFVGVFLGDSNPYLREKITKNSEWLSEQVRSNPTLDSKNLGAYIPIYLTVCAIMIAEIINSLQILFKVYALWKIRCIVFGVLPKTHKHFLITIHPMEGNSLKSDIT